VDAAYSGAQVSGTCQQLHKIRLIKQTNRGPKVPAALTARGGSKFGVYPIQRVGFQRVAYFGAPVKFSGQCDFLLPLRKIVNDLYLFR